VGVKFKITQAFLATIRPQTTSYDLPDSAQRGLVLRVWPSGRQSWLVRIGKQWLTLGEAADLPPAKAREMAQNARTAKASNRDPIAEKRAAKMKAATLGEFLTERYAKWAATNLKTGEETAVRVQTAFPDLLDKALPEITAFHVEAWRSRRHKAGVTPSTTNRDLDCLRSVLAKAVAWGLLKEHPLRTVKRARLDTIGRLRYLSADEEMRLRAALTAREAKLRAGRDSFNAWRTERGYKPLPRYRETAYVDHLQPLVLTALLTGARRGELFDLRWSAVDLARGEMTLTGATTKTGLTRRVPLCDEARMVLRAWRNQHGTPEPDALVFPSPQTGKRLDNITTAWGALAKAAKLTDFTFHGLRHTFASRLVERGVDLYVVQRLLGHASPIMTQRYAHVGDDNLVAAVATLNAR
jgi:integrase